MSRLRLALAQMNPIVGDLAGNGEAIIRWISDAKGAAADLVALPELAVTGYPPEDLVLKPSFVEENLQVLRRVAGAVEGIAAVVGFVDREGTSLFNAAALISDGEVKAVYHKHLLPNYGVFDEERYFEAGEGLVLGRLGGVTFGLTICEDVWSADGPHAACAAAGASLVININGSPYHRGKGRERSEMLALRAAATGAAFAYVNLVGGQDELVFDGQSLVLNREGGLLARARQFEEQMLVVDVDLPPRTAEIHTVGEGASEGLLLVDLGSREGSTETVAAEVADEMDEEEEVYSALVLGVRDYLGKNGFQGAIVGLSGGIDSSLTAAIAADAIGASGVLGVINPSEFSSEASERLGKEVAANLGIETLHISIHEVYEAFLRALQPVFEGAEWNVAEENLQSRIRGALWMAISNKSERIVLSTGNKSEMATGYATLYGDMVGGFGVLKDVPKTDVYRLAAFRNGRHSVIPDEVISRPPSAELRPGQLDTDALPPYEVLDPVLEAYVEGDQSIEEMIEAGMDSDVVRRVVEMVDRAEYKRRQAAPGIKITKRAFGRDRRLPITNHYRP